MIVVPSSTKILVSRFEGDGSRHTEPAATAIPRIAEHLGVSVDTVTAALDRGSEERPAVQTIGAWYAWAED